MGGRLVLHASTSGGAEISGNATLPNQAPPRMILSTDVHPHNPAEIDVLIARIRHAHNQVGAHNVRVAFAAGNPGR